MTRDELLDGYRNHLLTRTELFASLTAVLSARPDEVDATRTALAFEEGLRAAFDEWLEELKSYPAVLLGNEHVPVSRELVSRLGPPAIPPPGDVITIARISFTAPPGERPTGVFAAQVKTPADGETIPYGQHRVVVQPVAELDIAEAESSVAALIALSSPDAPREILDGEVELFQGTTRVATAWIEPSRAQPAMRRSREIDVDFLAEAAA